jgi:hypothetical protein
LASSTSANLLRWQLVSPSYIGTSHRCHTNRPALRRSASDDVIATPRAAVQRGIAQMAVIRLSREASERFAAMLIDPPDLAPAMQRAFVHHRRLATRA